MERKIGDTFDFEGHKLEVIESNSCKGCFLEGKDSCISRRDIIGYCSPRFRNDSKSIIFKDITNMKQEINEIKITVPEGMEIDKENSTFECIKFKKKEKVAWISIKGKRVNGFYISTYDSKINNVRNMPYDEKVYSMFATEKQAKSAIVNKVLKSKAKNLLLEFSTGTGKSKVALDFINKHYKKGNKILIVIPKLVLIENWKDEFKKWGYEQMLEDTVFTTYVSLGKHVTHWFTVVYDECFRGDTEILTTRGFVPFKDLLDKDLVAQWDNGIISFVKPERIIKRKHTGKICKVHLGRGRYCYMTPDHNQVYRKKGSKDWEITPIKDLKTYNTYIPMCGEGSGNNDKLTSLERLFIAIQADGTLQRHQIKESVYSIQVTRDRKKERLKAILSELNNWTQIKCNRSNTERFMCKLPKGDCKLLSTHFNIDIGYVRANDFIEEISQWDGSVYNEGGVYYSSKIKENADFVAAVAVQAGYRVLQSVEIDNRQPQYSDIHRVFMRKCSEMSTQVMKKEYLDYDDMVYCVEVPSHKIVVRSEGVTFITGNCHHLSERCLDIVPEIKSDYNILLSATVGYKKKWELKAAFSNLEIYQLGLRKAIEDDILPDPKVYLIPLSLDNKTYNKQIIKNSKCNDSIVINYADRYNYRNVKNKKIVINCTQQQYYNDISSLINYYKLKSSSKSFMDMYLRECGKRLKWLSNEKTNFVKLLLNRFKYRRVLTFCNSIEQTELICKYCINSKNKKSSEYLQQFNNRDINHISSVSILDEGINLSECEIGIFAMLNSSEKMQLQRNGRLLRHQNPIIIIPYYINTREEEIVTKMLENYNQDLVTKVTDIKELCKI